MMISAWLVKLKEDNLEVTMDCPPELWVQCTSVTKQSGAHKAGVLQGTWKHHLDLKQKLAVVHTSEILG